MKLLSILLFSFLQLAGVADEEVTMTFVGDAMQHGRQINAAQRDGGGTYDYSQCFTLIEDDISGADYAVANLETPLGGRPYSGFPVFSGPDEFALQLQASGFDLMLTANNHCMDKGSRGARRTVYKLREMGIPSIGTYASAAQRDSVMPFIATVKGKRIAMLNYTYGTNGIPVTDGVVVDHLDRELMRADITAARQQGIDAVCVCLHWGEEYERVANKAQLSLADFLVNEMGVDVIIGSHPHRIQPFVVQYSKQLGRFVPIAFSLGNFISNQNDLDGRGGAMALVTLKFRDGKVCDVEMAYKLLFVEKAQLNGQPDDNYIMIPASMRQAVRPDQLPEFDRFMESTRKLLEKHNSPPIKEQM